MRSIDSQSLLNSTYCITIIIRARKLLHLHVFCGLLDLLLSKLEINFKTLRKKYQKFIVHIFAYLVIIFRLKCIFFNFTIF